jgi:hypothetical protein
MTPTIRGSFNRRFGMRVLLPGAIILVVTEALCIAGLLFAGHNTDAMSLLGQQIEVWQADAHGMDDLAVGQESVGLCDECIHRATLPLPDQEWLDKNTRE